MTKIRVKGVRYSNRLVFYGINRYRREIPFFFDIELDLSTVRPRERSRAGGCAGRGTK